MCVCATAFIDPLIWNESEEQPGDVILFANVISEQWAFTHTVIKSWESIDKSSAICARKHGAASLMTELSSWQGSRMDTFTVSVFVVLHNSKHVICDSVVWECVRSALCHTSSFPPLSLSASLPFTWQAHSLVGNEIVAWQSARQL